MKPSSVTDTPTRGTPTRGPRPSPFSFSPASYERELTAILAECEVAGSLEGRNLQAILRRYPKDGRGFFSKSDIIRGYRYLKARGQFPDWQEGAFLDKLRMKPVRTQSGVAPVTVLTKPFPCPGKCIFCPSDVRMPKSYLSDEPGAQRAAEHQFDPYEQTLSRLRTYVNIGHSVDKVELIILGGTWSSYPEDYQIWFVSRCFEALNDFVAADADPVGPNASFEVDYREIERTVPGANGIGRYNSLVRSFQAEHPADTQSASWDDLELVHSVNESAEARCVGLVLETRPDSLTLEEALRMRRLGATKVQIGLQSLSDRVLELNRRGHDVEMSRTAIRILREAGFKIHAHWMPNLYGSSPERDRRDFLRLFNDRDFRPDELKIYPCSLIESAELMEQYESGDWRPYTHDELLEVLESCLVATPAYCRVTRMIRDIPGTDIVVGNRLTNFRELVEKSAREGSRRVREIRSREIGLRTLAPETELRFECLEYASSRGRELFLQYSTESDHLVGFLRLSLPGSSSRVEEIASSALLREVHVYGRVVGIGEVDERRPQHLGLGRSLVRRAADLAVGEGFADLAVISAVGTRPYYRRLGFEDGILYQHLQLPSPSERVEVGEVAS